MLFQNCGSAPNVGVHEWLFLFHNNPHLLIRQQARREHKSTCFDVLQRRALIELQFEAGGFAGGACGTKRVGTCWMSARVGFFFFGFFTSRLRASLFPMADSLPQVARLG